MPSKPVRLKMGTDENGINFYYDITTSNISFIQTASDLRKLGIENNMFFLKLYNRDLVGVDPYDPTLSKNMIKTIILECMMNPWYFWREVARIPEEGGTVGPGSGAHFILHRGNLAAAWCFLHSIDFYLVIPRQCYKTHSNLSLLLWMYLLGTSNSTFNFLNKSQADSDANLKKLKSHKELLPLWLQQRYAFVETSEPMGNSEAERKIFKGMDNVRRIMNPVNKNVIESKPSARTEAAGDSVGRGNSAPIQYYDEVEFTSYIGTIIQASGPAYVRSAETAERNGVPHCRIFTTTPGNIDSEPVKSSMATRNNAAIFTEHLYDKKIDEVKEFMKLHSKNGICYIEFTYRQIGMGQDYFNKMCEVLEQDKIKIKREVLLQRIRGASDSPFDPEDLDIINNNRKEPIAEVVLLRLHILYIYEEIDKNVPYLVGIDCASGLGPGSDNTAIVIVDPFTLKGIACLVTPYTDAVESSKLIVELVQKVVPRGLLCIERNNLGIAIIGILARTPVNSNLYYDCNKVLEQTGEEKLDKHGYLAANPASRRYWGVTTSEKSRAIMTKELLTYRVKHFKDTFICRELIDDLNNLIMKPNGRIEAAPGMHDDVTMAFCMALYVYEYGSKISNWGIIKGMKPQWFKKQEASQLTYDEIYSALPDELKGVFPAPGQKQNLIPEAQVMDDATLRRIENLNSKSTKTISSDSGNIVIRDNLTSADMVETATNYGGGNFTQDAFDLCDLFNE